MNILLFSHDKTLFEAGSDSQRRMQERGTICDSLTILVPTRLRRDAARQSSSSAHELQLSRNVQVIPTNSSSRFGSFWDLKRLARRVVAEEKIDLIISQDPFEFGWIATKLGAKFGIPVQVELHGDFYSNGWWKWSSAGNFIRNEMGKMVLRRAAGIRAVSSRTRASLVLGLGIPDGRISVFPVEVETGKYQAAPRGSFLREHYANFDTFVLSVGTLNAVKNVELQIQAMHSVVRHHPKTALVIVGDGPERKLLEMRAHGLRLAQNVIFVGRETDLLPYYMSADIFLLSSEAEGWGRVVIEAMAAGLAVVMTDVGLAGEFLVNGKNGIVVPRGSERSLAHAIVELSKDRALRARLGEAARETIRTLPTHEEMLRMYKQSWQKCLKSD